MSSTALITGASSGIGEGLARILSANGFDLFLVARSEEKLRTLADELTRNNGRHVVVLPKDLSDRASANEIYQAVAAAGGVVDVLVNNAGFGDYGPFAGADWEKTRRMLEVNIVALTDLTRLFLPGMVERGHGKILNIASTAAFLPGPLMSVYYATKAYVLHFSEGIATELEGTGVTVTAYCPGPVRTRFQETAGMKESRLTDSRWMASPAAVARDAFLAVMAGKVVRVHGTANYLLSLAPRFGPRAVARRVMRFIQEQRN